MIFTLHRSHTANARKNMIYMGKHASEARKFPLSYRYLQNVYYAWLDELSKHKQSGPKQNEYQNSPHKVAFRQDERVHEKSNWTNNFYMALVPTSSKWW
jgi:hypothetical protein